MRNVLIIVGALFLTTACAHKETVHNYCLKHISEYKDYDQCHEDVNNERRNAAIKKSGGESVGQAFQRGYKQGLGN